LEVKYQEEIKTLTDKLNEQNRTIQELNEKYKKMSKPQKSTNKGIDEDKFNIIKNLIPTKKVADQKAKRRNLFDLFDKKNLGNLTEEDMRSGIINILKLGELVDADDAITTAFQSASGAKKCTKKNKESDMKNSTIEFNEFRIFFVYLRQY